MTIVAANWVGENTSTVGTGPLALSGAINTFCPFSVLPDGSEVYYTLQEGFNRETGIGVVSNGTLTRKVQATLVAGVYSETDIPISLSGNGQVFAVINADFMTRIYNFSLDVADSVSAAAASAKSSSDSASLANDYKTQSAQNAESASLYAQSASDSKADATASKNAAAASASAAASSQADALASKNAAASSQEDALASKNAAKTSETNSKASENASAQSATNASNSAAAALASQNAAKTSENNASASKAAAKTSETNAKTSETNSKTSEVNSKTSETNAKTSETNAANSASAAANSAALAQQYQPNTALQLFTKIVDATAGNTMNNNLADGVYPVTSDSTGAPLAVDGKVWVTHRGTSCQQTWESQAAAGTTNYGRKFFRTGVDNGSGGITWGNWSEHVFMGSTGITKVLRGVDSTFTLGANATSAMHAVTKQQLDKEISDRSRFQQYPNDTRVVDPSGNRYLFVVNRSSYDDWGVYDVINNAKIPLPGSSGGTGSITYSGGWINLLNGRGVETARSDLGLGSLATLSTVSKNQLDYDLNRGTMFAGGRTNSQGAGVWTYDNTSFGWGEQFATCIQVSNRGNSDAGAGNGIWQHYLALCTSGNLLYAINIHGNYASYRIWSSRNTTVDGSGFIKQASPIVRVVSDVDSMTPNFLEGFTLSGSGSVNDEAEGAVISKIGTGKYSISGTTGLYPDGWQIEVPKDVNGNRLCFVEVSFVDGLILINSFKPKLDLDTGGIKAGDAIDIPIGRWVDVRVGMPDDSIYNQKQKELVSE